MASVTDVGYIFQKFVTVSAWDILCANVFGAAPPADSREQNAKHSLPRRSLPEPHAFDRKNARSDQQGGRSPRHAGRARRRRMAFGYVLKNYFGCHDLHAASRQVRPNLHHVIGMCACCGTRCEARQLTVRPGFEPQACRVPTQWGSYLFSAMKNISQVRRTCTAASNRPHYHVCCRGCSCPCCCCC